MKVIIPLAGYGTRLRPHTYTKPKPLINVAGKPVLGHILDKLAELNVSEYIFVVGYLGEQISEYVQGNYDFTAHFVEQKEMLGQSHAILLAQDYLDDEPVFIVFGDHIFETAFETVKKPPTDAVIFVKEVEDPRKYGVVMLDEQDHVISFVEKAEDPPTNLAIIGLYYINSGRRLLEALRWQIEDADHITKGEYYIADALQYLVDTGMEFGIETVPQWLDCGNPHAVLEANRYLLSDGGQDNSAALDFADAIVIPPVRIDSGTHIKNAIIGPHVTIAPGCTIENSIVKDAIVGTGSSICDALLEHSLIGDHASVAGRYRSFNVGDSSSVDFA